MQHLHHPTGFLPIVPQIPGLEMLQEHDFIWHKDTGEAGTCQLWNMVYFELSISQVFHYLKCSGTETVRICKNPQRRGLNVLRITLHYARPGEGQE